MILEHKWAKMDTLWFQQNYRSHPYMKKPQRDTEIELDIDKCTECLNPQPQAQQMNRQQVPNGSAELFRLNSQQR